MTKFLELLFLKQLKNIGNATINKEYIPILECINSIDDFLSLVERRDKRFSISDLKLALDVAERKYAEIVNTRGIEVITVFDDKYPARLHDLGDKKPVILYARGNTDILSKQSIAVVGTRKPSAWSEMVEQRLVQKILDLSDYVIISGLALGCDGIAHQTTLEANKKTVAVLPSGVNVITPSSHKQMAQNILDNDGCLLSEYEPKAKVTKSTYVERDAVVAALANATMVIECSKKSGTMHTVNSAFGMKRRLACYYIDDVTKGHYDGNAYMMKTKKATKVSDTDELVTFLRSISDRPIASESKQLNIFDVINE